MSKIESIFLAAVLTILSGLIYYTPAHASLAPDAKVPILLYHSWHVEEPCTYGHNNLLALEEDLEVLHQEGYTVVPVYWLVQWQLGWRSGDTLPSKPVGLTFDDGHDSDFLERAPNNHECGPQKSVYTILEEFRERHKDELPEFSPHAATFVIASKEVRRLLDDDHMQSNWWAAAHHSGLMEVYNHGTDHDHSAIEEPLWDEEMEVWLPASAHADNNWKGTMQPVRINNLESSRIHIAYAAEYIYEKIGAWPDLFAHPMGQVSNYARDVYFPNYFNEHGTVAAFCTERGGRGAHPNNYMQRGQNRWCLPRLTHGYSWRTPQEFLEILNGSQQ